MLKKKGSAAMAKDYTEILKKATPFHSNVVSSYNYKVSSKGFGCYRSQADPRKVMDALYKRGGGLTPDELYRASGVASRSQFDTIVSRMKSGTSDYQFARCLESVNVAINAGRQFGQVPDMTKINAQLEKDIVCLQIGGADSCMAEQGGKLYLWCHKNDEGGYSSDVLAAFDDPAATIRKCEKQIEDAKSAPAELDALCAEEKAAQAKLDSIGFFKFSDKKVAKEELSKVKSKIAAEQGKIDTAKKAEATLKSVYSALDSFN